MKRTLGIALAVTAAVVAIATPTGLAINLARRQALEAQLARALSYARDVLHRSDVAADQIVAATRRWEVVRHLGPCSDASLEVLRGLDLTSSYIQAVGYVSGDRLLCSSQGRYGPEGLPLGPVDEVTSTGASLRSNVEFAFAPGVKFTVVERRGLAAIIHKDLPIDASVDDSDVSLATFTPELRRVRSSRGLIKPAWMDAVKRRSDTAFVDGDRVVGVVRSPRFASGAIAALPIARLEGQVRSLTTLLMPIGLLAGLVLAGAVLYLARLQLALPAVIKGALRRGEFFLAYQPIVDLETRSWVGAEALIRWRRPDGELVRPDIFIPVAEHAGLIQRVTALVVEVLSRDARVLFSLRPEFHIGINIAASDLHSEFIAELLRGLSRDTQARPGSLLVEVTERGFANDDRARAMVHELRTLGMRIAIDDFGTGYSNLSYLGAFELDYLKIDKSFVESIGTESATSHVVLHIIEMAKSLNLQMIAEGVETEGQATFLRDHGVQYAQGWLFAKAMPLAELADGLPRRSSAALARLF